MLVLGIESTAHTFGIGIIRSDGTILANSFDSYTSPEGGMIPDKVAEHHKKVVEEVLRKALETAKISWNTINLIVYSAGPGLDPALWVGYNKAKEWSEKYQKKNVGVNHPAAHLSIGKRYNNLRNPIYLYVSGVNTQIIIEEAGKYHVLGETLDIGLGNMLDKLGRILGLGFPAGPKMEELAKKGKYLELPYVVKGMDVSFSGILTKAEQLWKQKKAKVEDLCFSVQETCFAMVTEVTERAIAHTDKTELVLVGGVGANKRFCQMLGVMCNERGARFFNVPQELARDNGVMIAWEGFLRKDQYGDIGVRPHWRVDEV